MIARDGSFFDFKQLDLLALHQTPLHRLEARAKVLTTFGFILCVVSFGKYEISALLPFFLYPVALITLGDLPVGYILRKVLIVIPFALLVGLFNPLFDQQAIMQLGGLEISGGWVSCLSILLRAILTATAAIVLVAITGFPAICSALEKLGMPRVFVMQLLFLYRYIFVLAEEALRTARARQLRTFDKQGLGLRTFGSLAGHLLLRTWQRAERIHLAMLARGFSGQVQATRHPGRFGRPEGLFLAGWLALFIILRIDNLPLRFGQWLTGLIG
ncbi:MAG: cobalt ECF transporter T component CbiQ [Desulfuromonadales bacterium]|jgi:cobalt/nickel transport system permease protein